MGCLAVGQSATVRATLGGVPGGRRLEARCVIVWVRYYTDGGIAGVAVEYEDGGKTRQVQVTEREVAIE